MRAISSAISLTLHAAVGSALLLGSTRAGVTGPAEDHPLETPIYIEPRVADDEGDGLALPGPIPMPTIDTRFLELPSTHNAESMLPKIGACGFSPLYSASPGPGTGESGVWGSFLTEQTAELLSGPLPAYPELLRQAGVHGRVVLEAVVDTTGRVLAQSITLVSATHSGFVEPARQALLQTLFRPAMAAGKPVRLRVRIPYDFTIRNGIGRAR